MGAEVTAARIENARRQPGANTSNSRRDHTADAGIKQLARRLIVGAAVSGLFPAAFGSWLLRRLGLVSE